MKFGLNSNSLLKHAIAKAKFVEFGVSEEERPAGLKNANDLLYSTIHALSKFAVKYVEKEDVSDELSKLDFVSSYYQSFIESENVDVNYIWILLGCCSNLLSDNFGNAKALLGKLKNYEKCENIVSKTLLDYLSLIFNVRKVNDISEDTSIISIFRREIAGEKFEEVLVTEELLNLCNASTPNVEESIIFYNILLAVRKKVLTSVAVDLVPKFSNSSADHWQKYFQNKKSIKILWQAQKLILEKEVLKGNHGLIQLPTGTGKTKCVELIAASAFLSRDISLAIYVAPLKALCNEVRKELSQTLAGIASVDELTDVIQDDPEIIIKNKQILICTPEKLSFLIKNNSDIMDNCGLIVFDEAHMFDDGTRGAAYEILVTKIKEVLSKEAQIIFISAVLPNAEIINNWATSGQGVLITDKDIKKTDKNVAFFSSSRNCLIYAMGYEEKSNIYIPNPIKIEKTVLSKYVKNGKKNKIGDIKDYFPKKENSIDVAICLAIQLCRESGTAIYINSPKKIHSMYSRMVDLLNKQAIPEIDCNKEEMGKIANLIELHYGSCELEKISAFGVLPHYGDLPNGVRLSVEYALKNNDTKFIVCTSTLAEGVNLPIRYLIMTSFTNSFQEVLSYRKFKNLFGRTARSGTFTEGSLICSDPKTFDEQNKGIRYFQWEKIMSHLNDTSADVCSSSILSLCNSIYYGYEDNNCINGANLINNYIIPKYLEGKDIDQAISELVDSIKRSGIKTSNVFWEMNFYAKRNEIVAILAQLENYIADELLCIDEDDGEITSKKFGSTVFEKTLAYHLADDKQKEALNNLFIAVVQKAMQLDPNKRYIFSKCLLGIDDLNNTLYYLEKNKDVLFCSENINEQSWIECIINVSESKHRLNKNFNNLTGQKKKELILLWIQGKSFLEIINCLELDSKFKIMHLEKICGNTISFELAMVFSAIIELSGEFCQNENIINQLKLLQKKIQYGLYFEEDIFAYEKGFSDRIVSQDIGRHLRDKCNFSGSVTDIIDNSKEIHGLLLKYPSYFMAELNRYM